MVPPPLLLVPPLRAKVRGMGPTGCLDLVLAVKSHRRTRERRSALVAVVPREEAPDEGMYRGRVHTREDDPPGRPWQILPAAASSGKGALTRAVTVLTYFGIAASSSRSVSGNAGPPESSKHADRPRSKTTMPGYTVRTFMVV